MHVLDLVITWPLTTTAIFFTLYVVLLFIYRLTLHPLAKFPGPRLAAVTFWCEFYHDYFCGGQYLFRIRDMHAKYGHIVRISPDELHINDPSFLPELMPAGGRRRDKYPRMIQVLASRRPRVLPRIMICIGRGGQPCPRCSRKNR